MANIENLVPNSERTPEERRANARKAGIASGEARRARKTFAECFDAWLKAEHTDKKGTTLSGAEALAQAVLQKATKGDLKAFEIIRDTVGEKPIEKVARIDISPQVRDEVEQLAKQYEQGNGSQDS